MDREKVMKMLEDTGKKHKLPMDELNKELEIADIFLEKREMPELNLALQRLTAGKMRRGIKRSILYAITVQDSTWSIAISSLFSFKDFTVTMNFPEPV